jgi:hypothetical protein
MCYSNAGHQSFKEERGVSSLQLGVPLVTLLAATVGGWSIHWAKTDPYGWRCLGGRILFVVNLLGVGAAGLVAAFTRAQGLPPLGLVAGLLIVGMLWEGPAATQRRPATSPHLPPDHPAF